jgi:hypothetical protein
VSRYLAQIERKQIEEATAKDHRPSNTAHIDPQFRLELPTLNEQERQLIQHRSLELSRSSSLSSHREPKPQRDREWPQLKPLLSQLHSQLTPL